MSAQSKFTIYNLQFTKKLKEILHFKFYILNSSRGFTLIELMVTIAIIAILSAVGVVVYSSAQKTGRISKRVQDLKAIQTALELYKSAVGTYPISTATANNCVTTILGSDTIAPDFVPTYMAVVPKDPLELSTGENCFRYQSNASGSQFKVWTQVPSSEMSPNDYRQQPTLVDPQRDSDGNCVVNANAEDITAWAVYSSGPGTDAASACYF